MGRALIEDHELGDGGGIGTHEYDPTVGRSDVSTTVVDEPDGGVGDGDASITGTPTVEEQQNPVDALFTGTRWRREDVTFALSVLNLLLLVLSVLAILLRS